MKPKFEGWYYKQQANGKTLALIPGKSVDGAFIHVISDNYSFSIPFGLCEYKKGRVLKIGDNEFSDSGIKVNIKNSDITLHGELKFLPWLQFLETLWVFFNFSPWNAVTE